MISAKDFGAVDDVLPNLGDVIDASNGQLESDLSLDNPSD